MEKDRLKRMLAGLSLAGLIAGAGPALGASATTEGQSSWGGEKPGAVSTQQPDQKSGSSWGGAKPGAVGTEEKSTGKSPEGKEKQPAEKSGCSGWGGKK